VPAYQGCGNYDAARRGYEKSLAMLRQDSTMKREFASATDSLGSLYFEMHALGASKSLRDRARNFVQKKTITLEWPAHPAALRSSIWCKSVARKLIGILMTHWSDQARF